MPGIIGRKVGMTSVYDAEGQNLAVTVIEAGPCVVTQVKNQETDGYKALQLAFGEKKEKNTANSMVGHFKKANTTPKKALAEFRDFGDEYAQLAELGKEVRVQDIFVEGDFVVFPAWTLHGTHPNQSKETRYIIGVNSMPVGKTSDEPYDRFFYPDAYPLNLDMTPEELEKYKMFSPHRRI